MTIILVSAILCAMYICICNGHRERDIRQAAENGFKCAREIYTHLGKPPRCGRCLDLAAKVIAEVHGPSEANEALYKEAV